MVTCIAYFKARAGLACTYGTFSTRMWLHISRGPLVDIKVPKGANLNGQNYFPLDNLKNSNFFLCGTMLMSVWDYW